VYSFPGKIEVINSIAEVSRARTVLTCYYQDYSKCRKI